MQTLADFLIKRGRELDAEEAKLREQKQAIDAERDQLWRAAKAAGDDVAKAFKSDRDATIVGDLVAGAEEVAQRRVARADKRASEATIKDAVLSILAEAGRGMTALEILPLVNERLGIDYPRTSLSPQLSRLKTDNLLIRGDGNVWSLVDVNYRLHRIAAEKNKGSDAQTSEPSEVPGSRSERQSEDLI